MEGEGTNLQNDFFNHARKERKLVAVSLNDGKRVIGRIKSFDKFTLLLEGPQGEQMIFKHAISTVSASSEAEPAGRGDEPPVRKDPARPAGR